MKMLHPFAFSFNLSLPFRHLHSAKQYEAHPKDNFLHFYGSINPNERLFRRVWSIYVFLVLHNNARTPILNKTIHKLHRNISKFFVDFLNSRRSTWNLLIITFFSYFQFDSRNHGHSFRIHHSSSPENDYFIKKGQFQVKCSVCTYYFQQERILGIEWCYEKGQLFLAHYLWLSLRLMGFPFFNFHTPL